MGFFRNPDGVTLNGTFYTKIRNFRPMCRFISETIHDRVISLLERQYWNSYAIYRMVTRNSAKLIVETFRATMRYDTLTATLVCHCKCRSILYIRVIQWRCHHSIDRMRFPIGVLFKLCLYRPILCRF